MRFYFLESQVPGLEPLAPALRQRVVRQALARARLDFKWVSWLPTFLCVLGALVGPIVAGFVFAYIFPGELRTVDQQAIMRLFGSFGSVAAGAGLAGSFGQHLQYRKLQPYLRKVMAECGVEEPPAGRAQA